MLSGCVCTTDVASDLKLDGLIDAVTRLEQTQQRHFEMLSTALTHITQTVEGHSPKSSSLEQEPLVYRQFAEEDVKETSVNLKELTDISTNKCETWLRSSTAMPDWRWRADRAACCRGIARTLVEYRIGDQYVFDNVIAIVILFNAVIIGVEETMSLQNLNAGHDIYDLTYLDIVEKVLLVIYSMELALRFAARGWKIIKSRFVCLDIILIFTGILSVVGDIHVGQIFLLRLLRMLRLIRALRLMRRLKTLGRIVSGLLESARIVTSSALLVLLCIFTAACLAIELISKDTELRSNPATKDIIDLHFNSMESIMLFFLQFVTLDDLSSIYVPLVKQRRILILFFVGLIMIVSVAMMNIIQAELVEATIMHAKEDEKLLKRKVRSWRPKIKAVFERVTHVSEMSKDEALALFDQLPPEITDVVREDGIVEFFDMLDRDGSGTVDEDEFVDGILHIMFSDTSYRTLQQVQLLRSIREAQMHSNERIKSIHSTLEQKNTKNFVHKNMPLSAE